MGQHFSQDFIGKIAMAPCKRCSLASGLRPRNVRISDHSPENVAYSPKSNASPRSWLYDLNGLREMS